MRLEWVHPDADPPITGYQYSIDGGETWVDIPIPSEELPSPGSNMGSAVHDLEAGRTYAFTMRAKRSDEWTDPVEPAMVAVAQKAPANLRTDCESDDDRYNRLNWGLINDCAWLLAIKDTLRGSAALSQDWSSSRPMWTWQGIGTGGSPERVTKIDLRNEQLTGVIPLQLGNLTGLIELDLSRNQLTGGIPPLLGNLTNLTSLNLGQNQLDGGIPAQLGNLTNLTDLYLYQNQLDGGIPAQLGNLTHLTILNVSQNELESGIPPTLFDVDQLQRLIFDYAENGTDPAVGFLRGELTPPLTWTLSDSDTNRFTVDDGVVAFNSPPDYENPVDAGPSDNDYRITVTGEGSPDGTADVALVIIVRDEDEPPGKPDPPAVAAAGPDSLTVSWNAPANTGPVIADYDIEYRESGAPNWILHDHTGTGTSATISGLESGTDYEVRVQAFNEEGLSGWSDAAVVMTTELGELTVSFGAGTYNLEEDDLVATITVNLSRTADRPYSIPVNVEAVPAGSTHYTVADLVNGKLSFHVGDRSRSFRIVIVEDDDMDDGTMSLAFGSPLPAGVGLGDPNSAILFIADTSEPPATPTPTLQPTATPIPEPTPTATPEPTATATAESPPEPTLAPTLDRPVEPTPVPPLGSAPSQGGGFPLWVIVVIVIGAIGIAVGAFYLGRSRNR